MALFPIAKPKVHSLTGRITLPFLHAAFKAVKRNRGAAGIDRVSLRMFEANLDENLSALERDLKDGSFIPLPLRRKYIPKEPGQFRPLGIPAVRDRVAQDALRQLLHPIFEPLFHDASFGFRPGRNCHQALDRVLKSHEEGFRVVLDADIKGFFDNLAHGVIMEAVAAQVADGNILKLIQKFLRAGVMEEGVFKPTTVGLPKGVSFHRCWPTSSSTIWTGNSTNAAFASCVIPMILLCSARPNPKQCERLGLLSLESFCQA